MKVKVGDKVYDSDEEPVMVMLDSRDKEKIAAMKPDDMKFCSCPAGSDRKAVEKWMEGV